MAKYWKSNMAIWSHWLATVADEPERKCGPRKQTFSHLLTLHFFMAPICIYWSSRRRRRLSHFLLSHSHGFFHRTRLGTVWPDLAKFWHFGKNIQQSLAIFQKLYLVFGSILNLLGQKIAIRQSFTTAVNGQILKNNIFIWSHWLGVGKKHK